jgi:hypothetical protein
MVGKGIIMSKEMVMDRTMEKWEEIITGIMLI